MSDVISDPRAAIGGPDREAYNRVTIEMAERVTAARAAFARPAALNVATDVRPEQVFPMNNRVGLGVALEYERMGNQPVSDDLQGRADALGFAFEHLAATIGSVIHGVDLHPPVSDEVVAFVRAALLERKVIFFRDQHLSEDEQVAFGRRFGDLDAFPFGPPGDNPFILEIAHGRRLPGSENGWHTDVTWMECPSLGSIAQVIELPPTGGDTLFADSHAAYLGLPPDLQERLKYVEGINDYRGFLGVGKRQLPDDLVEELKARIPFGVSHPLLRTHPETGKTALYLHGGFLRHDSLYDVRTGETLDPDDAKAIVAVLLEQHPRPEYQCRFSWEPGSVAFWDNRALQHYAVSDYWPHRRVLRRVTVAGDKPFFDAEA